MPRCARRLTWTSCASSCWLSYRRRCSPSMFPCGCARQHPMEPNGFHGEPILLFPQRMKQEMEGDGSPCAQGNQCSSSAAVSIALKIWVGHHEKVVAAVGITHERVGLTIIYPFSITPIAKLVASTDFQVNRQCPCPLLISLKGMRRVIPLVEIAHKVDAVSPGTVG